MKQKAKILFAMLFLAAGIILFLPKSVLAANVLHVTDNGKTYNSYETGGYQYLFLPKEINTSSMTIYCDAIISYTTRGTITGLTQIQGDFSGNPVFRINSGNTVFNVQVLQSDLPSLYIKLNGTTLAKVNAGSKDTKYLNNSVMLTDKDHPENDVSEMNTVEFKGRGNSTWRSFAKKPYQIKFDKKTSILGMPKAKKWVLLANHRDFSLLKNYVMYNMAIDMGMKYSCQSDFVDLWVDGDYIGNYQICQKVDVNSSSVDLQTDDGVLCELDRYYYKDEPHYFTSSKGNIFTLKEYKAETEARGVQAFTSVFQYRINLYEAYLAAHNWGMVDACFDTTSLADYCWLQEFCMNGDAMGSSNYMYMDGSADKIHMGPAWDFDIGFYSSNTSQIMMTSRIWYKDLFQMTQFSALSKSEYQKNVSRSIRQAIARAQEMKVKLRNSANMNRIRWNLNYATSYINYDGFVNTFIDWMSKRYTYLEGLYGAPAEIDFTETEIFLPRATLDEAQLKYNLVVRGVEIPETNTAVRGQVQFTMKKIAGFDDNNKTPVVLIGANGNIIATKSGVAEITATYNGITSTNKVTVIVPGDNNRDGKVSVSDVKTMMAVIREQEIDDPYAEKLCDMNGDGKVSAKDAMLLASMIRGRLTYKN